MKKFDRVISTLVLLQTKRVITASAISDRFDVSLRTVYRDIDTLKNAGIPIIGNAGIGYSILSGYKIPPLIFTEGEAAALLTAEKFIGSITDKDTEGNYSSALMKIKAILRSSEKQTLEVLNDSISISDKKGFKNKDYLQDLFRSISSKKVIKIEYENANGECTERNLEPIGCYHQFSNWYLVAHCQLKNDFRTFKMNRIVQLSVLEKEFETEHISLKEYVDRQNDDWKKDKQLQIIEISFNQSLAQFAESRKHYFGFMDQTATQEAVTMRFLNGSIEIMARWLIQFGDQATVVSPIELKDRMKTLVNQLYLHYK